MKYRRRIYYSAEQRAEIWDRWQRGESMSSIGRDYNSERIFRFDKIQSVAAIEGTEVVLVFRPVCSQLKVDQGFI